MTFIAAIEFDPGDAVSSRPIDLSVAAPAGVAIAAVAAIPAHAHALAGALRLAKELGPRKIRVNSLNPGMIDPECAQSAGFIGGDFQKGFDLMDAGNCGKVVCSWS